MTGNVAQQTLDAERLRTAVLMRSKGAHWSEIASACDYPTPAAALRAVGGAMAAATQRAEETADMMRDTASLRLDHLLRESLRLLDEDAPIDLDSGNQQDDRAVKLRAIDEARRIIESKAKLDRLYDKPDLGADMDKGGIRILGVAVEDII